MAEEKKEKKRESDCPSLLIHKRQVLFAHFSDETQCRITKHDFLPILLCFSTLGRVFFITLNSPVHYHSSCSHHIQEGKILNEYRFFEDKFID